MQNHNRKAEYLFIQTQYNKEKKTLKLNLNVMINTGDVQLK